jgi:hypothetical protein
MTAEPITTASPSSTAALVRWLRRQKLLKMLAALNEIQIVFAILSVNLSRRQHGETNPSAREDTVTLFMNWSACQRLLTPNSWLNTRLSQQHELTMIILMQARLRQKISVQQAINAPL